MFTSVGVAGSGACRFGVELKMREFMGSRWRESLGGMMAWGGGGSDVVD
jgi:hypothetical protein